MFFPLYREYNENPFAVLECPEFTQRLYDINSYRNATVTIGDTINYIKISSKNGASDYQEIGGQGLPTPELIAAASATGWRIPDLSDEPFYIYLDGGTRVSFKHYFNTNWNKPAIKIEPIFGIRHEEEYVDGSFGYQTDLFYYDYNPTDIGSITLHAFYCTQYGFRDGTSGDYTGNYRPAYVFFIRIRSRTGSLSDPIYLCAFQDTLLTLSDGDQKAPNAPNKTTRRGGMGTGSYPNRVNGDRLYTMQRNMIFGINSNGIGLTYYHLYSNEELNVILNRAYQLGFAKDNQYLRNCLISAYYLPLLNVSQSNLRKVRICDVDTIISAPIVNERFVQGHAYYDFVNNERYSIGWDNYADFTSTKLVLYLPFVGNVNINVNACQYSTLEVTWAIDVTNGNIVYWVHTRSYGSATDTLYGIYSGNCSVQIPMYGAGQSGSILGKVTNTVNALATGAAAFATGSPRLAIRAAGEAGNAIQGWIPTYNVERNGSIDTNSVGLQSWRISLKISMPKVLRCDSVQLIGLPSYYKARISEIPSGYHVVSAVDVDTIPNATAAEKEEIRRILMGGFYK